MYVLFPVLCCLVRWRCWGTVGSQRVPEVVVNIPLCSKYTGDKYYSSKSTGALTFERLFFPAAEADSFWCFHAVMQTLRDVYDVTQDDNQGGWLRFSFCIYLYMYLFIYDAG
jgi:hypothetical protein